MRSILIEAEPGLQFDESAIRAVVDRHLAAHAPSLEVEVSIFLVGAETMRTLNRRYRAKDVPTTILEFSQVEKKAAGDHFVSSPAGKLYLGDIVLCPTQVDALARVEGLSFTAETERILVHGLTNLFRAAGLE